FSEIGPTYKMGPVTSQLVDAVNILLKARNLDQKVVYEMRSLFDKNDQLEDVKEEENIMPYSSEAGRLGQAAITNTITGLDSVKTFLLPILNVDSEDFDKMLDTMSKELKEFHSYNHLCRVHGRKKSELNATKLY
ncbi:17506_t:CDS:2, partial [Acaulospora morrowiae]